MTTGLKEGNLLTFYMHKNFQKPFIGSQKSRLENEEQKFGNNQMVKGLTKRKRLDIRGQIINSLKHKNLKRSTSPAP